MLQVAVYMPIIKVNLPPNTEIFLESIRHVAEFEIFDSHAALGSIFSKTQEDPLAEQYQSAGFNSLYFLDNMQYHILVGAFFILCLMVTALAALAKMAHPRCMKWLRQISKKWAYDYLLRTINVMFVLIFISYVLGTKVNGPYFTYLGGALLVGYPFWTLVFLYRNRENLGKKQYLSKYWSLYGNLKFKDPECLSYPFVSLMRKVLFASGAILLTDWAYFQVQIFTLLNMFYIWYFASLHPNKMRWDFRLELFNEWAIQIMCFHMMCFTDMVQLNTEPLINYKLGESFKFFTLFAILVNLMGIGFGLIYPVRLYLRRRHFKKELPALIDQRMKEREAISLQQKLELEQKLNQIFKLDMESRSKSSSLDVSESESSISEAKMEKTLFSDQNAQISIFDEKLVEERKFKNQFYLNIQAQAREKEIQNLQSLNQDVDLVQKKIEKYRK